MGKKLLFVLAILATFLAACSSDKDEEIILSGTTWENSSNSGKVTLSFQSSTFALKGSYDYDNDGIFESIVESNGTYTIENSTVHLTANGYTLDCQIDGNSIYFAETENTNAIIFYRK